MADLPYQRLTRNRNRSLFSAAVSTRTSLWLGPDHLLCVDSNGYTETYKRFYFRDIQAITVQATKRRSVWNWILGLLTAVCLLLGDFGSLFRGDPGPGTIIALVCLIVLGIPLLLNNFFGRACTCQLRTAVQTEDLASLSRVRKVRKVLEKIRPLITAAQGELTAEEISARLLENLPPAPQNPPPENSAAPPVLS